METTARPHDDPESHRLTEDRLRLKNWKRWGPYLAERAWGTVREDYSRDGAAWDYFPHDHARSRVYRWNEDGLMGFCDRQQYICFALALWNRKDPILKERLFGLAGPEGNHGEDVKELYYYLDSTPTHSYMRSLYKYPQRAYPYAELVHGNRDRDRKAPELELLDTGIFDDDRYFDVDVEYAKASPEDLLVQITVWNRGPEAAPLDLLPTLWFRNTWSWGSDSRKPRVKRLEDARHGPAIHLAHRYYGERHLHAEGAEDFLFTENETNRKRLWNVENESPHVKDAFHEYLVHGREDAVNAAGFGTKAAALYRLDVPAHGARTVRLRLTPPSAEGPAPFDSSFEEFLRKRKSEADQFYAHVVPSDLTTDAKNVMRQSFAGLLQSKQYYSYDVSRWLKGDPDEAAPPAERLKGRNREWTHLFNADVISMPDKWEYPWYAAWDLAFHCLPLSLVDPDFAKQQLILLLREWYMHPNGQLPAYEWAFGDVNPPVHAWAAWRIFKIDEKRSGKPDLRFLERVFHKLLINFTWWVNRKDTEGRNVFQGGFLGLDNIGVFDRSAPLPTGGHLEQSDATSWMGMYCLNMLGMALRLAVDDPAYEDVASKFFEHFVYISRAMNNIGGRGIELWDWQDGFYYDRLHLPDGKTYPLKVRSMVGLIPLFAVESLSGQVLDRFPGFKRRVQWFIENRPDFRPFVETREGKGGDLVWTLALVNRSRIKSVLKYLLDESEFLSPHGIRALSRHHKDKPYVLWVDGREYRVDYEPAESGTGLFGGNSNWRGPIWFPVNFLIIEALQRYHFYLGDSFVVEYPTGSGVMLNLWQVAEELSRRLTRIFLKDEHGRRPVFGNSRKMQEDPHFRDHVLFYEYFNGDDGSGLGASHQTGWTGLVAKLLQQTNPHGVAASANEPESEGRSTATGIFTAPRKG